MTLEQLARKHHVFESVDKSDFQRKARILQSLWREEQKLPIGEHQGPNGKRLLGSRLMMPDAQRFLWNFPSEQTKIVVRAEVLDEIVSQGKLFGRPRLFNDLLSSQPLCFNLFAELKADPMLKLATAVFRAISGGRIETVTGIEFEYSPGRGDLVYSDDQSAFDVYVTFATPSGGKGFVGIEVKYHENLIGEPARHRDRYDQIAKTMDCFRPEAEACLKSQPLQQIWRDHLLAGSMRKVKGFEDGFFMLLYPAENLHCKTAIDAYRGCLTSEATFVSVTLEAFVDEIRRHTNDKWVERFADRYLKFSKIEALLGGEDPRK